MAGNDGDSYLHEAGLNPKEVGMLRWLGNCLRFARQPIVVSCVMVAACCVTLVLAQSTSAGAPSGERSLAVGGTATPACCNTVLGFMDGYCNGTTYRYTYGLTNSCPITVTGNGVLSFEVSPNETGPWTSPIHGDFFNYQVPPGYSERSGSLWSGPLPSGNNWFRYHFALYGACWTVDVTSVPQLACVGGTITPGTATRTATRTPTSSNTPVVTPTVATPTPDATETTSPPCGLDWRIVLAPNVGTLRGVATISNDDVWAVGDGGSIHWDGVRWSQVSTGGVTGLRAASGVSSDDVWAVGGTSVIHWDGTAWSLSRNPPNPPRFATYFGVTAISRDDVWIVGQWLDYSTATLAMHWDGSGWSVTPSPRGGTRGNLMLAASGISNSNVWAAGVYPIFRAQMFRWDGTQWVVVFEVSGVCGFNGVRAITSNDVWAVGYCGGPETHTLIVHYDGSSWSEVVSPDIGVLNGVAAAGPNDVWAVGDSGTLHWAGSSWSQVSAPEGALYGVDALSANDIWAVGDSVLHYSDDLFWDVAQGSTFYPFVQCLACGGVISGYSDGTFRPNNQVTRGQLSKIVSNSAGFTEDPGEQRFEDVPLANAFYNEIQRLGSRGYIGGYECGGPGEPCISGKPYFRPNANATRGQISKIVSNAAEFSDPPSQQIFEDVPPSHTFYEWVQRLASRSIMSGYPCGGVGEPCISGKPYFRPQNNATRGQTSKIVSNTFFPECQLGITPI